MSDIADYAFQLTSILIAAAALVYAVRANRNSEVAIEVARQTSVSELRLRVKESLADAERSVLALQSACQGSREQWENHFRKHGPVLGSSMFKKPPEVESISNLERLGRSLLTKLRDAAPAEETADTVTLERFIGSAQATSLEIARLQLQIDGPRPLWR